MIRKLSTPLQAGKGNMVYTVGSVANKNFVVVLIVEVYPGLNRNVYDVYVAKKNDRYKKSRESENGAEIHDATKYLNDEKTVYFIWKRIVNGYEMEYDLNKPLQSPPKYETIESLQNDQANQKPEYDLPQELLRNQ